MKFTKTTNALETVVAIEGSLDAITTPEIRPFMEFLIEEQPKKVVVDVSAVEFIDSSGVAVIASLFKRLKAVGGTVTVSGAQHQPAAVFKLLGVDRIFCRPAV